MMDNIFADMIDGNFIIVYMDDIFLFAPDEIMLVENTKRYDTITGEWFILETNQMWIQQD